MQELSFLTIGKWEHWLYEAKPTGHFHVYIVKGSLLNEYRLLNGKLHSLESYARTDRSGRVSFWVDDKRILFKEWFKHHCNLPDEEKALLALEHG